MLAVLVLVLLAPVSRASCVPGQVKESKFLGLYHSCQDCQPGTYQNGESCVRCDPGTFTSSARQTQCEACATGKISPNTGAQSCSSCAPGTYTNTDNTKCEICPLGTHTNAAGSGTCAPCPGGSYADARGSVECALCEDGLTSPSGSVSRDECTGTCSAGYIHVQVNGTVLCEECPAGSYSWQGARKCGRCEAGTYSVPGSGACFSCARGTVSREGSGECVRCPAGTVAETEGLTTCVKCPKHTFSAKENTECKACETGSWSGAGSSGCILCQAGTYHNGTGGGCALCPKGSTSEPGAVTIEGCIVVDTSPKVSNLTSLDTVDVQPEEPPAHYHLNYKQTIGLVFASAGIFTIVVVVLYILYWGHQRDHFSRNMVQRDNHGENYKLETRTRAAYNTCQSSSLSLPPPQEPPPPPTRPNEYIEADHSTVLKNEVAGCSQEYNDYVSLEETEETPSWTLEEMSKPGTAENLYDEPAVLEKGTGRGDLEEGNGDKL